MQQASKLAVSPEEKKSQEWTVVVGKDKFTLNGNQIEVIKQADKQGMRGMVWFDKFAISIPHIQSISYVKTTKPQGSDTIPDARVDMNETSLQKLMNEKEKLLRIKSI